MESVAANDAGEPEQPVAITAFGSLPSDVDLESISFSDAGLPLWPDDLDLADQGAVVAGTEATLRLEAAEAMRRAGNCAFRQEDHPYAVLKFTQALRQVSSSISMMPFIDHPFSQVSVLDVASPPVCAQLRDKAAYGGEQRDLLAEPVSRVHETGPLLQGCG